MRRAILVQRFERERDILAGLEHPHIARLYDAGFVDDGQPYLALEYVEGKPIHAWCREQSLPVADRVRLLLQVAEAVAYAHSRLVLHRDLKPGNILVTSHRSSRFIAPQQRLIARQSRWVSAYGETGTRWRGH